MLNDLQKFQICISTNNVDDDGGVVDDVNHCDDGNNDNDNNDHDDDAGIKLRVSAGFGIARIHARFDQLQTFLQGVFFHWHSPIKSSKSFSM